MKLEQRKIIEIVDAVRVSAAIDYAVDSIRKELNTDCLSLHVPIEFEKNHGIRIESNLSILLEFYHQMRLKQTDEKETNR